MDRKKEGYSLLLNELEKILTSLNIYYDPKVIEEISSYLEISKYNFLEKDSMNRANELLKNVITITILKKDDSILFKLMKIYCSNTQFYLDNIDTKEKNYSNIFLNNLNFYVRLIMLIIENNMISNNIMEIIENIQNQVILSKLFVQFESNKYFIAKFENGKEKSFSSLEKQQLNDQNAINNEISSALILLFRDLIKNKRQNQARTMISILRRNLFIKIREDKVGGVVEKLLELHGEYLQICIEEKDRLSFTLFYSLRDVLDKIYDPKRASLDNLRNINEEYLPLVKKTIYNSLILLIISPDKEYVEKILEGVIEFYKTSRVFEEYAEKFPYLLEKLFYSVGCFCFENNYFEILKIIINHSISLPKEYILVNEKKLLPINADEILKLFDSEDYSSMEKNNIQLALFLILISKFYNISNKKSLEKIFQEIYKNKEVLRIVLMHKSNFEVLIKRSNIYHNFFKVILGHDKFLPLEILSKEFLKFISKSEKKIEAEDGERDLDNSKIKSFVENLLEGFEKSKSIDEILKISSINKKQKFNPICSKTRHDKIWFVEVSGTTAYASDNIGRDIGGDFASHELRILTQELNNEIKETKEFKDKDNFVNELEKMKEDELVLLCPFSFNNKIRDLIRYDYNVSPVKTFIKVKGKRIQIQDYPDRDKIRKIFIFPKKTIAWERQKFDFNAIRGSEEEDLLFKDKHLEAKFITQDQVDKIDKDKISETEVIIQILYGYKIKIVGGEKMLSFKF